MLRDIHRAVTEDNDRLAPVWPVRKGQDLVKGVSPHDEDINSIHEFLVPVILYARGRQPVDVTIFPGDEPVKAGCDIRGRFQRLLRLLISTSLIKNSRSIVPRLSFCSCRAVLARRTNYIFERANFPTTWDFSAPLSKSVQVFVMLSLPSKAMVSACIWVSFSEAMPGDFSDRTKAR